ACEVTATNREGSASVRAASVVVPKERGEGRPKLLEAPTVSGEAKLGSSLQCSQGVWSGTPAPAFTYTWLRDRSVIAPATSSTYTIVEADLGHTLTCEVTATNEEGSASAASAGVPIPGAAPRNVQPPQVVG